MEANYISGTDFSRANVGKYQSYYHFYIYILFYLFVSFRSFKGSFGYFECIVTVPWNNSLTMRYTLIAIALLALTWSIEGKPVAKQVRETYYESHVKKFNLYFCLY